MIWVFFGAAAIGFALGWVARWATQPDPDMKLLRDLDKLLNKFE